MSHDRALIITDGGVGGLLACWAEGVVRAQMDAAALRTAERTVSAARTREKDPRPVAWLAPLPMPARQRRREAVERHAELCSLLSVVERPVEPFERDVAGGMGEALLKDVVTGAAATRLLLAAAEDAVRLGLSRIVWPVHLGDGTRGAGPAGRASGVDRLASVFERALLVGQLASIDLAESLREEGVRSAGKGVAIETPYVDFTDVQMMELALDMDCPVAAESGAWVCEREGGGSKGQGGWPGCGSCDSCVRWRRALRAVDPAGDSAPAQAAS